MGVALAFRLVDLDRRVMHGDEAVQAFKAWDLHAGASPAYVPSAFHGRLLSLLIQPGLDLAGPRTFADTAEWMFRLPPALAGAAVAATPFLFAAELGGSAALVAAALIAVSPAMVYYSRDAIQEMLLVLFTALALAAWRRWLATGRIGWLAAAGAGLGLMAAAKETAILAAVAALGATLADRAGRRRLAACRGPEAAAFILPALGLLWRLQAGGGGGPFLPDVAGWGALAWSGGEHAHPFPYYLGLLGWARPMPGGPVWTEAAVLALAAGGMVLGRRRAGVRWLARYAAILGLGYSALPYKTPWCVTSVHYGLLLLAGAGAVEAVSRFRDPDRRRLAAALLTAAGLHLGWQAARASFVFASDWRNPWAYAQPGEDVRRLAARVAVLGLRDGRGARMPVVVATADVWPLPWALRRFGAVEYRDAPAVRETAPVVIATPADAARMAGRTVEYFGLRPGTVLALAADRRLADRDRP